MPGTPEMGRNCSFLPVSLVSRNLLMMEVFFNREPIPTLVLSCAGCKTLLGDSEAYVGVLGLPHDGGMQEDRLIVLHGAPAAPAAPAIRRHALALFGLRSASHSSHHPAMWLQPPTRSPSTAFHRQRSWRGRKPRSLRSAAAVAATSRAGCTLQGRRPWLPH